MKRGAQDRGAGSGDAPGLGAGRGARRSGRRLTVGVEAAGGEAGDEVLGCARGLAIVAPNGW